MARPRRNPASRDQQERLNLNDEQVVQLVMRVTKKGEDAFQIRRRRYDHSYDVWRASERRPRSLDPWQSRLRVPYAMQTIDTALVNINTGVPRVIVSPRHPDVEVNAKAMQVLMDYFMAEDHVVEKQPMFVQQGLVYGVTVAKNHWLYKQADRNQRGWMVGSDGQPQFSTFTSPYTIRDGPSFEPWNIYDCWWDPNGRDIDTARYVVLRSWMTKDQLMEIGCTKPSGHNRNECNGILHNVPELLKTGPSTQPMYSSAQQRFLAGSMSGASANQTASTLYKDLYELLEVWTDDTVTTVGNRKILMRNEGNPYWHGHKPVVLAQTRPDMFEMQGVPETEVVDHLQQAQWTLQNMTIDNLHLTTMRGVTYREGGVSNPNALQLTPRFKWPVQDHDDIRPFEIPPIASDVYQERTRLLSDMQLVTGINPYVSGADLSTVDQNTATGVTALQEVASRLLRFKAQMIQYKGYQRSYEMWGDMIQQFLDQKVWVNIVGPAAQKTWVQLGPEEVAGHFNYVLEGSEESLSRQQERGEAIALLNAFAPLAPLGFVNYKPILERVALAYDFPNPDELFLPPGVQPAAAPSGSQMDQQQAQQQNVTGAQGGSGIPGAGMGGVSGKVVPFPGILSTRIGDVYGGGGSSRARPIQGAVPLDPQLADALSQIRPF